MSAIMREAFERWQQMRDDFELVRHAQYERAVAELRGELLNQRGRENHIDPYSLFMGSEQRAMAYASKELIEWWQDYDRYPQNRRWTLRAFEIEWLDARTYDEEETTWQTT